GYGLIFPCGDGTANVGLGILDSSPAFRSFDPKDSMRRWLANTDEELGFRDDNLVSPYRSAALPMGFNRKPHYGRGLLLVGDSGGMVNPFIGEGIAYAIEAGEVAAAVAADALKARTVPRREALLRTYADRMDELWGSYYRMGGIFVHLIGHPAVMKLCTEHGLKRPALMRVVLKLLANLTDQPGRDVADRIVNGMRLATPSLGRGKPRLANLADRANVRLASFAERRV
ncbi:MAG TPA: hypothetical protein VHG10_08210, partial [Glycomyces sp.]|nr:hypothetical protein [Glycomyces sp.]